MTTMTKTTKMTTERASATDDVGQSLFNIQNKDTTDGGGGKGHATPKNDGRGGEESYMKKVRKNINSKIVKIKIYVCNELGFKN